MWSAGWSSCAPSTRASRSSASVLHFYSPARHPAIPPSPENQLVTACMLRCRRAGGGAPHSSACSGRAPRGKARQLCAHRASRRAQRHPTSRPQRPRVALSRSGRAAARAQRVARARRGAAGGRRCQGGRAGRADRGRRPVPVGHRRPGGRRAGAARPPARRQGLGWPGARPWAPAACAVVVLVGGFSWGFLGLPGVFWLCGNGRRPGACGVRGVLALRAQACWWTRPSWFSGLAPSRGRGRQVNGFLRNKPALEALEPVVAWEPPPVYVSGYSKLRDGRAPAPGPPDRTGQLRGSCRLRGLLPLLLAVSAHGRLQRSHVQSCGRTPVALSPAGPARAALPDRRGPKP